MTAASATAKAIVDDESHSPGSMYRLRPLRLHRAAPRAASDDSRPILERLGFSAV